MQPVSKKRRQQEAHSDRHPLQMWRSVISGNKQKETSKGASASASIAICPQCVTESPYHHLSPENVASSYHQVLPPWHKKVVKDVVSVAPQVPPPRECLARIKMWLMRSCSLWRSRPGEEQRSREKRMQNLTQQAQHWSIHWNTKEEMTGRNDGFYGDTRRLPL